MKNFVPSNVARMIFGLILVVFSIGHFTSADMMAPMVPAFLPGKHLLVYFTGLALLAAGVSMIWGKMMKMAGYLLALMLIGFVVLMHVPGMSSNPMAMPMILKDLSMALCAILIANDADNAPAQA